MTGDRAGPGVRVPPALAGRVAEWVLAGLRAELAAERDHGGAPFHSGPYVELARALRRAATSASGSSCWTDPAAPMSTAQVAVALGVTVRRVRQRAAAGTLPARRTGRDWAIYPEVLR